MNVSVQLRDVFCVHRTPEGDAAALQGLSLTVGEGELLSVLGPSGAGKSTLLRVIAGVQAPSAGVVQVLGVDIGRLAPRLRARLRHQAIGFLNQCADASLPPDLPVGDAVALPLALRGERSSARRARVDELLELAELAGRRHALPGELSGGERQRVALCAAIAHRPSLLLADEPTGELDEQAAATVRALITELARARRTSVILVSHDPAAAEIADRCVLIRDGRVVEDRRDGEHSLHVAPGGWIQLPPELLAQAGIGERATVERAASGLVLRAAGGSGPGPGSVGGAVSSPAGDPEPGPLAPLWAPARVQALALERSRGSRASRRVVLDGLSRVFAPGRLTVVTGRSGAGKTTLLELLAGLDRPSAGEVLIDEQPLTGLDGEQLAALRRDRIGYLPQEPLPVWFLSAEENVVLSLRLRGWDAGAARERAVAVLARVGLADRARQRAARLSAGEAQRVALARALAGARGLLIVDEPSSRLDQASATVVGELLAGAARDDRQTVICASHDPELVALADEVVAL